MIDEVPSLFALALALALACERVVTIWINRRGNGKRASERGSTSNGIKAQQLAIDHNREAIDTLRQDISGLMVRVEEMGRLLARVDERSQRS